MVLFQRISMRLNTLALCCVVTFGDEVMAGKKGGTRSVASATNTVGVVCNAPQDGTGNLSKRHRDELVRKLDAIKKFLEKTTDTNAVQLLRFAAEVEKEVRAKKFGLVFEEHKERVDVELERNLPVLTEDKDRFIDNGGEVNFLIEGENLAALKLLEKTHRGKIDLIYIDPPYNTGNKDFIYNDSYVDANDTFRHSKWLSFMKKRLEIARRLLQRRAAIFISIDDNELAPLKMLCDDIFGPGCFVSDISWQRTYSPRNDAKGIVSEVEHILVYGAEEGWQPAKLPRTEEMDKNFKNPDNDTSLWTSSDVFAPDSAGHQGMVYAVQHPFTGKMLYPPNGRHWSLEQDQILAYMNEWCPYELRDIKDADKRAEICGISRQQVKSGVMAVVLKCSLDESKSLANEVLTRGQWPRLYFTAKGKGGIRKKTYLENVGGTPPTNLWLYEDVGHTDEAKKEVKAIFGGKSPFDTPKPVRLLERIITIMPDGANCTILDFFAGSGTTGHAVMSLNAKDGGTRKFILVTNNENGICEKVTYERLKRVIEKENYAARLKYCRLDYVPIDEKVYYEYANDLLKHIRELVELENAVDFSQDKTVTIALTDGELEKLAANKRRLKSCKAVYVGHDVLIGHAAKEVLKKHGVKVNIIPQYYYPELEG